MCVCVDVDVFLGLGRCRGCRLGSWGMKRRMDVGMSLALLLCVALFGIAMVEIEDYGALFSLVHAVTDAGMAPNRPPTTNA